MVLNKNSILFSAECYMVIIALIALAYSLNNVYRPKPIYLHQLETLEDLIDSTIDCKFDVINQERSKVNNLTNLNGQEIKLEYRAGDNASSTLTSIMPKCPIDADRLKYFNDYELNTWLNYQHVLWGGRFKPVGCKPVQRVAIVIPYRDRREHLEKFSLYIHQFLPDQLVDYTLYVIEQSDDLPFNRAKLFNVGVAEIIKLDPSVCCFIFHDVDLLPLDQRNLYTCSTRPRHMSPGVSTLRYKLLYQELFGGVISMTKSQFETIGGFSNAFYGWGGEDDDIFRRVRAAGFDIERAPEQIGVYTMLKHSKMEPNPSRFQLLKNDAHGATPTYSVENIVEDQLFTVISVRL